MEFGNSNENHSLKTKTGSRARRYYSYRRVKMWCKDNISVCYFLQYSNRVTRVSGIFGLSNKQFIIRQIHLWTIVVRSTFRIYIRIDSHSFFSGYYFYSSKAKKSNVFLSCIIVIICIDAITLKLSFTIEENPRFFSHNFLTQHWNIWKCKIYKIYKIFK